MFWHHLYHLCPDPCPYDITMGYHAISNHLFLWFHWTRNLIRPFRIAPDFPHSPRPLDHGVGLAFFLTCYSTLVKLFFVIVVTLKLLCPRFELPSISGLIPSHTQWLVYKTAYSPKDDTTFPSSGWVFYAAFLLCLVTISAKHIIMFF